MLILLFILVLIQFTISSGELYCRIIEKENNNNNNNFQINAPFVHNNIVNPSNQLTIDCKAMQDNIIDCNKIGDDDNAYELKCGLFTLNCTTEYNSINPSDKNNLKCKPSSNYYYSYASSYTSSRRKLQDNSDGDSLLLNVWSQSQIQIHINDKLVFEGSGNTWDQPWNLLKVNPLVDTFSITLHNYCHWWGCTPGGIIITHHYHHYLHYYNYNYNHYHH